MKKRLMGFTLIIVLVSLLISNAAGVWFLFNQQREDARQNQMTFHDQIPSGRYVVTADRS